MKMFSEARGVLTVETRDTSMVRPHDAKVIVFPSPQK